MHVAGGNRLLSETNGESSANPRITRHDGMDLHAAVRTAQPNPDRTYRYPCLATHCRSTTYPCPNFRVKDSDYCMTSKPDKCMYSVHILVLLPIFHNHPTHADRINLLENSLDTCCKIFNSTRCTYMYVYAMPCQPPSLSSKVTRVCAMRYGPERGKLSVITAFPCVPP